MGTFSQWLVINFNTKGQNILSAYFDSTSIIDPTCPNTLQHMSHLVGKPTMWFPNRSDTNRPVQLQKQARSLKFWTLVEEELYYPSSENKGADQLRSYREADLRLCFRLCRLLVFPRGGSHDLFCKFLNLRTKTYRTTDKYMQSTYERGKYNSKPSYKQKHNTNDYQKLCTLEITELQSFINRNFEHKT